MTSIFPAYEMMLGTRKLGLAAARAWSCKSRFSHGSYYSTQRASKLSDPLRILFCGSDNFSCTSLLALCAEKDRNPNLIQSIDVLTRRPKPVGRGQKTLEYGPLYKLATFSYLRLHLRDTFTGWDLPQTDGGPINLIIAVSFGLFVPPRLLRACKYGGLNIHPSLLPDLRGPAPLWHAMVSRDTHTGISLQTLSEDTFDAGTVIAQTPLPGIPINPSWSEAELNKLLADTGADMLVRGLREGLHVPPHVDVSWAAAPSSVQLPLRHAPKVTKDDYQVQWTSWTASDLALRSRLRNTATWTHAIDKDGNKQRILFPETSEEVPRSLWSPTMQAFARMVQQQGAATLKPRFSPAAATGAAAPAAREASQHEVNKHDVTASEPTTSKMMPGPKKKNVVTLKTIRFVQTPRASPLGKHSSKSSTSTNTTDSSTATSFSPPPSDKQIRLPVFYRHWREGTLQRRYIVVAMPRGGFIVLKKFQTAGKKAAEAHQAAQQFIEPYAMNSFLADITRSTSTNADNGNSDCSSSESGLCPGMFSWLGEEKEALTVDEDALSEEDEHDRYLRAIREVSRLK
ncbi:formyl transferase [Apodospora peruviana]|uniref:methionyl-tRNA formyltransferase n=1 Tax=Apodospora peruviana TaxID=516989 RepID=A0AAE0MBK7_9PEZI|nr:formyl transferase [Apodospora peruviana]